MHKLGLQCKRPMTKIFPEVQEGNLEVPTCAVYGHSLIINSSLGMDQEIHHCWAISIGSVQMKTWWWLMMRQRNVLRKFNILEESSLQAAVGFTQVQPTVPIVQYISLYVLYICIVYLKCIFILYICIVFIYCIFVLYKYIYCPI